MRISKKQLRKIIREACALSDQGHHSPEAVHVAQQPSHSGVPSPRDYDAVRGFMAQNPELVDLGISMVMDLVGVSCERSTAQAIIDHLQGMVGSKEEDVMFPEQEIAMQSPEVLEIKV